MRVLKGCNPFWALSPLWGASLSFSNVSGFPPFLTLHGCFARFTITLYPVSLASADRAAG